MRKAFLRHASGQAFPDFLAMSDINGLNGQLETMQEQIGLALANRWNPNRLSGTTLWIDPQAQTGIDSASNVVSGIVDASALGLYYNQSAPENRPTFDSTGFNGRAGLLFNGTQSLVAAGQAETVLGDGSELTVVCAIRSSAGFANTFFGAEANTDRISGHAPFSDGMIYFDAGNTTTARQSVAGEFVAEGLLTLSRQGATGQIRRNGTTLIISAELSGVASLAGQALGIGSVGTSTTNGLAGAIGGLIVVKGPLHPADLLRIEGWLAHRTGLQNSLPTTHPFCYNPPLTL